MTSDRRMMVVDLRSLAVFRIGLGGLLVADALLRTRDFALMFAPDGMFPLTVLARVHAEPGIWSLAFLVDASWWSAAILILQAAAGAALALGWKTPVAKAVAWVALVSVIRRTSPATNAGDLWLAALLFWSLFLPLGSRFSLDRRGDARPGECRAWGLTLQIAGVYLAAGLSKCNEFWLSGDAVRYALSTHDHGTRLGDALAGLPDLCRWLTWAVLVLELAAPPLLIAGGRVRPFVAAALAMFHAGVWLLMSVGLFSAVGLVACSLFIPASAWPVRRQEPTIVSRDGRGGSVSRWASGIMGGLAGAAAILAWIQGVGMWPGAPRNVPTAGGRPLPWAVAAIVNGACLPQDWQMFADVLRQRQWVYSVGRLTDGGEVDVLRGGRRVERRLPEGGHLSLPHHRWHKLLWVLHEPRMQPLREPVTAALARSWNAIHPPDQRLVSLEIRVGRLPDGDPEATLHELLVGSWPARDDRGRGNLDRLLEEDAMASPNAR